MPARAVMVLGTTSGAGKSWLATALCRYYARQGLKVRPFKAQNMSNNARVVPGLHGEPGEIGSAQYFQALAARAEPDVRMNPVLLKPERDTASQVVVLGQVRADLAAVPWRERSARLWPAAREALHELRTEADVVVIEGAGSPAEINLRDSDYVNMRTAREARAACLLVTDIDRGGAFAHLWGTHQLLPPDERALIRGFVLNRFRGDVALLPPGPEELERLTGVPTLAVLPMWRGHGLPEEDGVFDPVPGLREGDRFKDGAVFTSPRAAGRGRRPRAAGRGERRGDEGCPSPLSSPRFRGARTNGLEGAEIGSMSNAQRVCGEGVGAGASGAGVRIAVVAYPRISNLDELQPLRQCAGVELRWARAAAEIAGADWVILPGSKNTSGDRRWMREQGFDEVIRRHAAAGRPVLGICGGLQMLGERLSDPHGVDGDGDGDADEDGLGLLPVATRFERGKLLRRARVEMAATEGAFGALAGLRFDGYEIRHGRTAPTEAAPAAVVAARNEAGEPIGWQRGNVLGLYAHGLFEAPGPMLALFGRAPRPLDEVFDGLADFVAARFRPGALMELL